jgi:hypothetical protein
MASRNPRHHIALAVATTAADPLRGIRVARAERHDRGVGQPGSAGTRALVAAPQTPHNEEDRH